MRSVLIRCDASLSIGSGHVMRCRNLARQLHRLGAVVTFLCRRQAGDLIDLLEQEFAVLPLPELIPSDSEDLTDRALYRAWLGCSQAQDAADCLHALRSASFGNPDWLVVDHYGLDASWESLFLEAQLGEASPKLLVIDDLADRPHKADLLLDQNFFGELTEHRYNDLVPQHCCKLLGPHYALLGSEYAQLHPLVPNRKELQRVLVFFGGVDPTNLTARSLEALMHPALAHLAVDVVIGRQSLHWDTVAHLVAQRPFTTLHGPLPSLAGLIARADLAIGAAGATTWERACLKLPSLVVSIASNQDHISKALNRRGLLRLLGDSATVTAEQICAALMSLLGDFRPLEAGGDLTDGCGVKRLALAMLGPQSLIRLQRAEACDEALLLRWANDPQVRASSFSPAPIASLDHHKWFCQGLADPNRLLLIATANDCPIGQIRFDRQPPSTEVGCTEVTVDISIDRCARGFGLSSDLVRLGLQAMERNWGSDIEAVADVLKTNPASNACFKRAGFTQERVSREDTSFRAVNRWRCRLSS